MVSARPFLGIRDHSVLKNIISCKVRKAEDLFGQSERMYTHSIQLRAA